MYEQIKYKDIPEQFQGSYWMHQEGCWYCKKKNKSQKAYWLHSLFNPEDVIAIDYISFCNESCANLWLLDRHSRGILNIPI